MCDPITILTIGSTVLGAAGQIQQSQATAAASKYNAQVANMNATINDQRAKDAINRGALEEQKKRQQVAGVLGQQKAAMAANGVDVTFGSPLDTLVDTSKLGELDALTIRTNSYREAYDYKVAAANNTASANLDNLNAKNAETGGYLSAAGTILTGAGSAYKSYKTGGGIGKIS
jgi:hypothetical protein